MNSNVRSYMNPIDAERTGKCVYRLLKEEGYSARAVAGILGFEEPQAVYNWKYGKRMPNIDNLDRISRLLNISVNDLLVHVDDEEVSMFCTTYQYIFWNL